jgi:hypothetical protein
MPDQILQKKKMIHLFVFSTPKKITTSKKKRKEFNSEMDQQKKRKEVVRIEMVLLRHSSTLPKVSNDWANSFDSSTLVFL